MKKSSMLLSVLMSMVMTLTPISAFAESGDTSTTPQTVDGFSGGNDKLKVSVSCDTDYSVKIPDSTDNLKNGDNFKVSVNAVLAYNQAIVVTVESENNWHLVDESHADNTIKYDMEIDGKAIKDKSVAILEARYDAENHNSFVTLTANGIEKPNYAGTYSDLMTFTVEETTVGQTSIFGA